MKKILLLGATGSIGTNTVNCIKRFPDLFKLVAASAHKNSIKLIAIANEFSLPDISLTSVENDNSLSNLVKSTTKIHYGESTLVDLVNNCDYDILVNALVGAAGFRSTIAALLQNKTVALANKESLVIGGDLIATLLKSGHGKLIPIDSEHSAILQCLNGENRCEIESITVTASGGPFKDLSKKDLEKVTPKEALKHPTWTMGSKITIDSATLMNKGFEVIEAHYLFGLPYDKINVVVHPQSIVHSMVTFQDGAVMCQCGVPDMELPIQYALSFPSRFPINSTRLDLVAIGSLTFSDPNKDNFPCLDLCIKAGKQGGTIMAALNASNEVAIEQFLNKKCKFTDIPLIIDNALNKHINSAVESVNQIMETDNTTRLLSYEFSKTLQQGKKS